MQGVNMNIVYEYILPLTKLLPWHGVNIDCSFKGLLSLCWIQLSLAQKNDCLGNCYQNYVLKAISYLYSLYR